MTTMAETPPPATPILATPGTCKLSFYSPDEKVPIAEFSPLRYTFTPKPSSQNVKLPKAWERRPATPFKPRGTGKNQKIWKRVFQDENAIDAALDIRKQKQNINRKVVKRLKLEDAEGDYNGKSVGTKWDCHVEDTEHKGKGVHQPLRKRVGLVSNRQGALGKNGAGPRRRSTRLSIQKDAAADVSDTSHDLHRETCVPEATDEVNEEQKHGFGETLEITPDRIEELKPSTPDAFDAGASRDSGEPLPQISTEHATVDAKPVNVTDDDEGLNEYNTDSSRSPHVTSPTMNDQNKSGHCLNCDSGSPTNKVIGADIIPVTEMTVSIQSYGTAEDSDDTEVMSDTDMDTSIFAGNAKASESAPNEEHSSSTVPSTRIETFQSSTDGMGQSSELKASQSLGDNDLSPSTSPTQDMTEALDGEEIIDLPSTLTQSFAEPSPEDDTEFLQGFLSRAQAKKAAKAAIVPGQWEEPMRTFSGTITRSQKSLSADNQSVVPANKHRGSRKILVNENEKPMTESTSEIQATSPRRSSRCRVLKPTTKIAPAVPSTIPVRRSNGTEFVFLQKDEVQRLALTTRRNTQRNKGEAVHPTCRLLELKNPPQEAERSERSERSRSTSQSPRKRAKKTDKQVQWDNQLAYFQERQRAREKEESSKSGTKKVRRLGTPATKRRMEKMALKEEGAFDTSSTLGPSEVRLRLRGD